MSQLEPNISESDHVQGKMVAPVTLVEFGDYECPYCGEAYPMIKKIQRQMGPDLRFVFRNFPLKESHPHALMAAMAAEAANQQGEFWEMHDFLYEHQYALEPEDLAHYAEELGLDLMKFRSGFDDESNSGKIKSDFRSGIRSGVNGTPSFYINGEKFEGDYSTVALLAALESSQPAKQKRNNDHRDRHNDNGPRPVS